MQNSNQEIHELTKQIVSKLDADFLLVNTSYNSLPIHGLISEILKSRGFDIKYTPNRDQLGSLKAEILKDLDRRVFSHTQAQVQREIFYLGYMVSTIIHSNIPIDVDLSRFGKVSLSEEEIDS